MNISLQTFNEHHMMQLLQKMQEEYHLYECMIELCQSERSFISNGEWDKLRESLSKKNALLNEVERIDTSILSLKEEWNTCRETLPMQLKNQITALLEQFKTLMEKLVSEQKHNEALVQERTQKNEQQLGMIRKGKNLGKAYSAYGSDGIRSKFMDKRK